MTSIKKMSRNQLEELIAKRAGSMMRREAKLSYLEENMKEIMEYLIETYK